MEYVCVYSISLQYNIIKYYNVVLNAFFTYFEYHAKLLPSPLGAICFWNARAEYRLLVRMVYRHFFKVYLSKGTHTNDNNKVIFLANIKIYKKEKQRKH